jgi:glucose/arabinose dehydrogenase
MRVRTIWVMAGVVSAGLALFAATGFGDDEAELRSFDTDYSTERAQVHRVGQPSGQVSAAATGQASKKAKKAKLLFFETPSPGIPVGPNASDARELECPRGKVVTGYFLPANTETVLALTAPSTSRTTWAIGVRNFDTAATQVILGIVCETGVK